MADRTDDQDLVDVPPRDVPARRRRSDRHRGAGPAPTTGRRSRQRRRRRLEVAQRVGIGLFAVVAVALAVVWWLGQADAGAPVAEPDAPAEVPSGATDDPQPTMVLVTFDETRDLGAELVMLLATRPDTGASTIVLVPSSVVAEVPGEGLFPLGETFRGGAAPLLELTLANLLGLDLDGSAAISEQGWSSLFTRIGGLTLDVPEQLVEVADDGTRRIRFQPGVQPLDGPRVAEYLTFEQPGETELQQFPRVKLVLETLLERLAEDPDALEAIFADGAPMVDTPDGERLRFLLASLARSQQAGSLVIRTLPVTAISSGEDASYRIDEERVDGLVAERLAASRPTDEGESGRRIQVLNGNGTPGIGSRVAELLQPGGFRLVETGNADSFDVPTTRIIVYEDTPEQLAVAKEVQRLLGVGRIEVSEVPISVVDITVIVGQDFPPG